MGNNALNIFYNSWFATASKQNCEMWKILIKEYLINDNLKVFTRNENARFNIGAINKEELMKELFDTLLSNASEIAFSGSRLTDNELINTIINWAVANKIWDVSKINELKQVIIQKILEAETSKDLLNGVFFPLEISRRGNPGGTDLSIVSQTLENYARSINPKDQTYSIYIGK